MNIINAVLNGDIELVKKTVNECNIDYQDKSRDNKTPLMLAIINGQFNIAKYLVDKGADVLMKDDKGNSALSYASVDKFVADYMYACAKDTTEVRDKKLCNIHENVKEIIGRKYPDPKNILKSTILQNGGTMYEYKYLKYKNKYLNLKESSY